MNRLDREEYEPPTVTDIRPVTGIVRGGRDEPTLDSGDL